MRGARVLEFAGSVAGAYCAKLLATSGADVVLVEPPAGSPLRRAEPRLAGADGPARSALHEYLAAGRRSVVLPEGAGADDGALDDLFAWADVVISTSDGDPAPVLARHERLHRVNPAAVHVVASGFGLSGPWSHWRRSALTDWAAGGHLYLTGRPEREPLQGGGPWDSYLHGATAAIGAEAGLIEAARTGRGCLVDVAAMDAMAAAHQWTIVMYTHTGVVKGRWGNRLGESHHPMALFPTKQGWVCIGAASLEQWENFCITTGAVELLADDRLYAPAERFDRADEIDAHLLPWLATRTAEEAVEELQANRVPAGKVLDFAELLAEPHLAHRSYWAELGHLGAGARIPAAPFRVGPLPEVRPAPEPGAHTAEVLAEARATRVGGSRPRLPSLDLRGVRVVEFSVAWAGPLTGRFLADLGADVIKVEHPTARGLGVSAGGDAAPPPWTWGTLPDPQVRASIFPNADPSGRWWNRMGHWNKMNRGKRSLALDAKAPGGAEVLDRLLATADVVVQNYTPRGAKSLGIDHERLARLNPRVISVAMSGYGETGPMASHASWGPILEAHSGFDEATGYLGEGEGPTRIGVAYPDAVGGVHGAVAVLAALWEREVTGQGQHVDLAQLESLVAMAGELVLATSVTGRPPARRGNRSRCHAPQGVYRCAGDDAWVALTVQDDAAWERLVALVDRPGLRGPELATEAARHEAHDRIDAELAAWAAGRDKFAAAEALQGAGVAAAPVMTNRDLVENEHLAARGFMVTWDQPDIGPLAYPGFAYHVDGAPPALRRAPTLGEHNDEVLQGLLGLSAEEVAALEASGAIATAPPS